MQLSGDRISKSNFEWVNAAPYVVLHVGCLAVFLVGFSWIAIAVAIALYAVRMFAVTAFYHRYFSHRAFRTSRAGQLLFAILANTAMQRGALWWAATHRHHHQHSDAPEDKHSPSLRGFWTSHLGWLIDSDNLPTDYQRIPDLAKYPELVFLNKQEWLIPLLYGGALYAAGAMLETFAPGLGTNGWQLFVWGFFISTTILLHGTLSINSLAHLFGTRRYQTTDDSRNSLALALITLGEGWHNNHHRYPHSVRQGFYWWELDVTYLVLRVMSWTGLIWDLRPVPAHIYQENR